MLRQAEKLSAVGGKQPTAYVVAPLLANPAEAAMPDSQAQEVEGRRVGRWLLDGEGG